MGTSTSAEHQDPVGCPASVALYVPCAVLSCNTDCEVLSGPMNLYFCQTDTLGFNIKKIVGPIHCRWITKLPLGSFVPSLGSDIDMTGKGTVCELNERVGLHVPLF